MPEEQQNRLQRAHNIGYASGKLAMPAFCALPFLFLYGLALSISDGFTNRFLIFTLGPILSFLGFYAYSLAMGRPKQRSWFLLLLALLGWTPYLFGCYVTFYEGFWRLRFLADGFSIGTILAAAAFIILGYMVVLGIYRVSELGRKLDEAAAT